MINRHNFFEYIRPKLFGDNMKQPQVDGCNFILDAWDKTRWGDLRWCANGLATTYHETNNTMEPVREAYWLSEQWRKLNLRYYPYYGRGFVQLTWEGNYAKATKELQAHGVIDMTIDLVKTPDLAMRPDIAAYILWFGMGDGWFTGRKFSDYFNDKVNDPYGARQIINGEDKATLIEGYHKEFFTALVS